MAHDLLTLAFQRPAIDWHGIAPELVLLSMGALITLVDILFLPRMIQDHNEGRPVW